KMAQQPSGWPPVPGLRARKAGRRQGGKSIAARRSVAFTIAGMVSQGAMLQRRFVADAGPVADPQKLHSPPPPRQRGLITRRTSVYAVVDGVIPSPIDQNSCAH